MATTGTFDRAYDFSTLSVMIADGSSFMRNMVGQILRGFEFGSVHECESGPGAWQCFCDRHLDLVICEWSLPGMKDLELPRKLRDNVHSADPFIPIIMLTAHSEKARVTAARDAGATEFLAKPVSAYTLLERIIHVVEHPRNFVRSRHYFGPDRRRREAGDLGEQERRADIIAAGHEDGPGTRAGEMAAAMPPAGRLSRADLDHIMQE